MALPYLLESHPEAPTLLTAIGTSIKHLSECFSDAPGHVDVYGLMQALGANQRVVNLFHKCDSDFSGVVSKAQLAAVLATDEKAVALLAEASIDMPTGAHKEFLLPHVVFKQLDLSQSGTISLDEFTCRLDGVLPITPRSGSKGPVLTKPLRSFNQLSAPKT